MNRYVYFRTTIVRKAIHELKVLDVPHHNRSGRLHRAAVPIVCAANTADRATGRCCVPEFLPAPLWNIYSVAVSLLARPESGSLSLELDLYYNLVSICFDYHWWCHQRTRSYNPRVICIYIYIYICSTYVVMTQAHSLVRLRPGACATHCTRATVAVPARAPPH